jgi:Tol biopolymer transport system component
MRPAMFVVPGRGWLGVALLLAACVNEPAGPLPAVPPPAAPPSPPAAPPSLPGGPGKINVTVSTIGVDIDPNGYLPWVDGNATDPIDVNGSVTIANLAIGSHLVRLEGLAPNCVVDGLTDRSVEVTSTSTASVSFTVSCVRNGELAFVDGAFGNIYVINSDGTGTLALTKNQWSAEPAWSPDGSRIAFVRYRESEGQGIFVMNANGTGIVGYSTGRGDDRSPAWSPDGAHIAFVSYRDSGNAEIYVMTADGKNPVRLTRDAGRDADPAWSPDGSRIAFARNSQVYTMNSDGSAVTKLTPDGVKDSQPAWSPDGSMIAFSREAPSGNSAIFTMQADGSAPTRLTQDFMHAGNPAWSKDGRLAFETVAECHPVPWWFDECTGEILIVRPDKTTYYVTSIGLATDPAWRP